MFKLYIKNEQIKNFPCCGLEIQKEEGDQIDEDWIYTLKHYLGMLQ
jgi:hypothetical protein